MSVLYRNFIEIQGNMNSGHSSLILNNLFCLQTPIIRRLSE